MEKNITRMGILAFVALSLILGSGPLTLWAAEKVAKQPAKQSSPEASLSENNPTDAVSPNGQNVEKLLYTLNETLQENRKIRQSMRDLQEAFEKVTVEKSDVSGQMRKVELLAIQRNKETGQRIDELSAQLDVSKKEIEKLQAGSKVSFEQKLEMEKKFEAISTENTKLQELLKSSILAPERDKIVERMKKNEEAVKTAVSQVSYMDGENVSLKEQLIQSYFDLGNMFYDLGRFEDAAVQYLHVLEWDPYHAWSHHNLAVIYDFHLHKYTQAIAHYQKYLQLKPPSEEAGEARMRLWDLRQLSKVTPGQPLKQDFDKYQRMPRS